MANIKQFADRLLRVIRTTGFAIEKFIDRLFNINRFSCDKDKLIVHRGIKHLQINIIDIISYRIYYEISFNIIELNFLNNETVILFERYDDLIPILEGHGIRRIEEEKRTEP